MNSEALRFLDEMRNAASALLVQPHAWEAYVAAHNQLRAILSAQEPTAEHWRQAAREMFGTPMMPDNYLRDFELYAIALRDAELAKQTNCTASDDTPSKSRAKRIEKQREVPQ